MRLKSFYSWPLWLALEVAEHVVDIALPHGPVRTHSTGMKHEQHWFNLAK